MARSVVNWSAALSDLGYPSYSAYLRSPYWAKFRAEYYRRYGRRCQANMCNRTAEHVHHATYERLGHERFNDVLAVCAWHHELIHRKAGGIRDLDKLLDATIWCCGTLPRKGKTLEQAEKQAQSRHEKNLISKSQRKRTQRKYQAVPCPQCGAAAGEMCRSITWGKAAKSVHSTRREQYVV